MPIDSRRRRRIVAVVAVCVCTALFVASTSHWPLVADLPHNEPMQPLPPSPVATTNGSVSSVVTR